MREPPDDQGAARGREPGLSPAATVAVLAERSGRRDRRALRTLARTLADGGDPAGVDLPPRFQAVVAEWMRHGRLPEVVTVVNDQTRRRRQRGEAVLAKLAYPTAMLLAAAGVATFVVAGLQMSTSLNPPDFTQFGVGDMPAAATGFWDLFPRHLGELPSAASVLRGLVRLAALLAIPFSAAVAVAVGVLAGGHAARWPWRVLPFGRAAYAADAESEFLGLTAVFVEGDRPLPEALHAVAATAASEAARQYAEGAARRARQGENVFVSNAGDLFGRRSIVSWLQASDSLAPRRLREDAEIAAAFADAAAVRSCRWTQILLVLAAAGLLIGVLLSYWLPIVVLNGLVPLLQLLAMRFGEGPCLTVC